MDNARSYKLFMTACLAVLFASVDTGRAASPQATEFVPGSRQRQWPPKTDRVLPSQDRIDRARQLCESDENAKAVRDKILKDCEYWLAMPDRRLHDLLPDYRVTRDFDVSAYGCPTHGTDVYAHGAYPWILDRERPFTITCPIGGEQYPSNDFEAYYRSGMTDRSLLTGPYADDGRGWVAPDGRKYWMVAYACHWNWSRTWLPALKALSQAYLLTDDTKYAHKAVVMLDRIAEIYPGMDYSTQSRYGELMQGKYHGKISNHIWETGVLKELVTAYDLVFPALSSGAVSLPWRSAEEIRAYIEANLLEEGLDEIERERIAGNYGFHQNSLIYTALVRQAGPTDALLRGIFELSGKTLRHEGLNYAMYNLVYKDGMPYETSPSYGSMWVRSFVAMADPLAMAGHDIYALPKMKQVFDGPLDLICAGQFTPTIGDTGSIRSGWIIPDADTYEAAYRRYREPRFAWAYSQRAKTDHERISRFDDLFKEFIVDEARTQAKRYHHQSRSRLLDGFGVAILNNTPDTLAVAMHYGEQNVHSHKDTLNIELYGLGKRLSPDLGYPDQTDNFHAGIFSWTSNTISHNCLMVDRAPQTGVSKGKVLRFHGSPTVHVVDIDAPRAYAQADVYRRSLVQVDTGADSAYLVDVFRVRGGKDHCLSLHGAEGEFTWTGSELPAPVTEGTLAGKDVPLGALYDDPVLGQPGYQGSFKGYAGSGYSHFFNWQAVKPDGGSIGQWSFAGEPAAGLRVHVPAFPGQEIVVADAYVSPQKHVPTVLKYMLVRRSAVERGNTFVVVWEPYGTKPEIDAVEVIGSDALGDCEAEVVVVVKRGHISDTIAVAGEAGRMRMLGSQLRSDGAVAVVSRERGERTRLFAAGGTKLVDNGTDIPIPPSLVGTVRSADYPTKTVTIEPQSPWSDPSGLIGRNVRLFNEKHSCMYPIAAARLENDMVVLELGGPEPMIGRMKTTGVDLDARTIATTSFRPNHADTAGAYLVSLDYRHAARIELIQLKLLHLVDDPGARMLCETVKTGGDLWIMDFGTGDRVEVEAFAYESKPAVTVRSSMPEESRALNVAR